MNDTQVKLRAIILHGAQGGPETNWFPWLQSELEPHGTEVVRPRFPTPQGQSLDAWFDVYDARTEALPALPTILVGHSLGAAFALRLVERSTAPINGLFLAAGFVGALGLPDYDAINASFFLQPFDWTGIRKRMGPACHVWAGNDDPYVPLARSQSMADSLEVRLEVVPSGGHLNSETGFTTFPQLRDAILADCANLLA